MQWNDLVNGSYELLGGVFVLLNIIRLLRDKQVKGVSIVSVAFFTSWGYWNLHYYAHLGQWCSWLGGIGVVTANTVWVGLMIYYVRKSRL